MLDRRRVATLWLVLALGACGPAPEPGDAAAAPEITVGSISGEALLARIDAGQPPLILDVRTAEEYTAGHIPGAANIPHTEIDARLAELGDQRDREIIVHCRSGTRAGMAEKGLVEAGYTNVIHLEGDFQDWQAQGRPVVTEAAP